MRRLRPIRRRRAREQEREPEEFYDEAPADELHPFVPVESAPLEAFSAPPEEDRFDVERPARARRPSRRLSVTPGALALAALLIAAGVIGTLLNLDRIELDLPAAWPVGVLAVALIWLVSALSRGHVTSALGAAALAGAGLSALLDTQGIAAWRETLIGLVLVALGLGIVLRGLLLRQNAAV